MRWRERTIVVNAFFGKYHVVATLTRSSSTSPFASIWKTSTQPSYNKRLHVNFFNNVCCTDFALTSDRGSCRCDTRQTHAPIFLYRADSFTLDAVVLQRAISGYRLVWYVVRASYARRYVHFGATETRVPRNKRCLSRHFNFLTRFAKAFAVN